MVYLKEQGDAADAYRSSEVKEMLELTISEAKIEQYNDNGRKVDYDNVIGYNGILQEKVPEIENWIGSDILLCHNYYFQVMSNLKIKQVDFNANYKSVKEMKSDGANLKENDIVSTLAYYEGGSKSGGGIYKITSDINDLVEDEGKAIKIDNTDLYAILETNNNSLNVMQYGAYGDGKTDDTIRLQKVFDMFYKNGGGTVYFPSGTYITRIQENTGYSSTKACLTILGGNINLIGSGNSEIKQVGFNYGDLADDYFYDENEGKYYRGNLLYFGSKEEPINNNITLKGVILNGGASTMPSYEDSRNWDGKSPTQWDITHKGIYLYNGANADSDNIIIDNCVLKNFRGEAYYGGSYLSDNSKVRNTTFENNVTAISAEGIIDIDTCNFIGITCNSLESYIVTDCIIENCKFENCQRGLDVLNNNKWGLNVKCEILNCSFDNVDNAIRSYGGGIRIVHDNKFNDCASSFHILNTDDGAHYSYYNNESVLKNQGRGNTVTLRASAPTDMYNNTFKRIEEAKENKFKADSAFNIYYDKSQSLEDGINNCNLYNNYVEPGYCTYGANDVDREVSWNVSSSCNKQSSYGGIYIGFNNPYDTSSMYGNGVYRNTKIDVKGTVNEDCDITIKIEYYLLGGEKNETMEEVIYTDNKKAGENFVVTFDKAIITDARQRYPVIKIYNSNNSSTAVNATFTMTQY